MTSIDDAGDFLDWKGRSAVLRVPKAPKDFIVRAILGLLNLLPGVTFYFYLQLSTGREYKDKREAAKVYLFCLPHQF